MRTLLLTSFTPAGRGTVTSLHRGRAQTTAASALRSPAPGTPRAPGTPTSPASTTAPTRNPTSTRRAPVAEDGQADIGICGSSFPTQRQEGPHHPQAAESDK